MKNLILAGAFALSSAFAFANTPELSEDVKVSYAVEQSFLREFGAVKNVSWKETRSDMFRATFDLYEETISAFFTHEGQLVATTINKELKQLPGKLRATIDRKLHGAAISEVFEMTTENEHCYYFKVVANGETKLYKGYSSGGIQLSSIALQ